MEMINDATKPNASPLSGFASPSFGSYDKRVYATDFAPPFGTLPSATSHIRKRSMTYPLGCRCLIPPHDLRQNCSRPLLFFHPPSPLYYLRTQPSMLCISASPTPPPHNTSRGTVGPCLETVPLDRVSIRRSLFRCPALSGCRVCSLSTHARIPPDLFRN